MIVQFFLSGHCKIFFDFYESNLNQLIEIYHRHLKNQSLLILFSDWNLFLECFCYFLFWLCGISVWYIIVLLVTELSLFFHSLFLSPWESPQTFRFRPHNCPWSGVSAYHALNIFWPSLFLPGLSSSVSWWRDRFCHF